MFYPRAADSPRQQVWPAIKPLAEIGLIEFAASCLSVPKAIEAQHNQSVRFLFQKGTLHVVNFRIV